MLNLTRLLVGRWLRTRRTCPYINGFMGYAKVVSAALNILRLTLPRCTKTLLHRMNGVFRMMDQDIVIGFHGDFQVDAADLTAKQARPNTSAYKHQHVMPM